MKKLSKLFLGTASSLALAGAAQAADPAQSYPDVPTITESGVPGYRAESWQGLLVPAERGDIPPVHSHIESTAASRRSS